MSYIVNNGQINGEVQVGQGLGSRLKFRGRIFDQQISDWTEIHGFKHFACINESSSLGGYSSLWGEVDAFLRNDGIFEHRYPKHEHLILGTFCRYAREIALSVLGADVKFHTDYDSVLGLVIITDRDGKVWNSLENLCKYKR